LEGLRADFLGLAEQPVGIQPQDKAVIVGHMLRTGRETPDCAAAGMNGDLLPLVENLHHPFAGADLHLLVNKCMRHAVEVLFKGNMVVNIDLGSFPGGKFIWLFGQGT